MILRLLRRDPAARLTPIMTVMFAALGALSASTALEDGPRTTPPDLQDLTVGLLMVSAWAIINYFAVSKMHEIASPFEMAMPIDARTMWTVRMIGILAVVSGGIAGFGIGFMFLYDLPLQPHQWTFFLNATGLILLMPFVYHSVRVRSPRWGMPLPVYLPLLAGLIYGCLRLGMDTLVPGTVALGLAALLGAITYIRLPKCFELPTDGGDRDSLTDRASFDGLDALPFAGRYLAAARALRPPAWFTRPQTRLLIGLVLTLNLFALSLSPYAVVLVLVLAQFAWFTRTLNGGSRLAHLPISRARVFLHATMPGFLAGGLGVVALVAYLPDLGWTQVFADKRLALGVVIYAFAWWFALSLLLLAMATPPATASAWKRRHLTKIRNWCAVALTLLFFGLHLAERARAGVSPLRMWELSDVRSAVSALADALPLGAAALWVVAAFCCAAAFWALRREFLTVETAPATDF